MADACAPTPRAGLNTDYSTPARSTRPLPRMFTRLTVALVLGCMLNADVRAAKGAPPPLPAKIAVRVKAVEAKLFADLQA